MQKAVSGAIRKRQAHTRSFLGSSYLSKLIMSDSGDISAVSNNAEQEDVSLLSQMSDWDKDIIDHDIGINFGTSWCYRLIIKGLRKEYPHNWDLGSRKTDGSADPRIGSHQRHHAHFTAHSSHQRCLLLSRPRGSERRN